MRDPQALTAFQMEVAHVFFALPASEGFVVAGGAALIANELTARPTCDLDFFRSTPDVLAARDEFEAAAAERGWTVTRVRDSESFVRLQIDGSDTVLVDLCLDSAPIRPPVDTQVGPTFAPEELAGRKLIALLGRAEARDFADVFALLAYFPKEQLLDVAAELDTGFSRSMLAEMFRSIERHDDERLEVGGAPAAAVRATFLAWAAELEA